MLNKFWTVKIIKSFELNLYSIKFWHIVCYTSMGINVSIFFHIAAIFRVEKILDGENNKTI